MLLAERTEGVASVAHALAYCHAIERIAGVAVPWPAALVRVLHAELERLASHLDVAVRLADAAGLAVATARFGVHKERVLRLVSRHVRQPVRPRRGRARRGQRPAAGERREVPRRDRPAGARRSPPMRGALMGTASFLDRLRRHRAAAARAGPRARRARPGRQGVRVQRRRAASPARMTPTRRSGCGGIG